MTRLRYATDIKSRLSGFEGEPVGVARRDMVAHPDFAERLRGQMSSSSIRFVQPSCSGEVRRVDHEAVQTDIANLKAVADAAGADQLFMTAGSPAMVAQFFKNRFYPSREAYLAAIADAMRVTVVPSITWAKFAAIVEGASLASRELA